MQKIHSGCIIKRILVILKSEGRFDSRKFLKSTADFYISNSYPGKHGLPKTQNFLHPQTWKNGLHWANTNGYSPKSMKKLLGCYTVDYSTWFYFLPQIIKEKNKMVYFLIDRGSDWYFGEEFWIFESYVPELVKALDLLSHTDFLDNGWLDYYIVSKKYQWLIGFNHHDIISCIGEGLHLDCFQNQ